MYFLVFDFWFFSQSRTSGQSLTQPNFGLGCPAMTQVRDRGSIKSQGIYKIPRDPSSWGSFFILGDHLRGPQNPKGSSR